MKKILILFMVMAALSVAFVSAVKPVCNDNPGSIWTTDSGCSTQDKNQYNTGDEVWIAGHKFCQGNTYSWSIKGQPGGASCTPNVVVASGQYSGVASDGTFCFKAYTVADADCGEYKVDFNGKNDNYRVEKNLVPEFGLLTGLAAFGAAGAGYLAMRKRR